MRRLSVWGSPPGCSTGAITVTPVRDTQLLQIKVEGTIPELIAQIANTLPAVFMERNAEMQLGRVAASKIKLEEEIANTEKDLAETQQQLKTVTDDAQRTRLETSLAQYRSTYSTLVASYQQSQTGGGAGHQ